MERRTLFTIVALAGLGGSFSLAKADDVHGTPDEAKALVEKAAALIQSEGAEKAFPVIDDHDGPFVKGDLYVFVASLDGTTVAHGANKAMIGKNLKAMKDADGKYFLQEMISVATTTGSGWVDYKWPNPVTKKIENKSSFVEKAGEYLVGCGVYKG
jgi:signal transduction histidine kinase